MREAIALVAMLAAAAASAANVRVVLTDVPDSPIREVRAEAVLDVRADALFAAIADVERYPAFMPYVEQSRILAREAGAVVDYQRLAFGIPLVAPRHYAIRLRAQGASDAGGRAIYEIAWTLAGDVALPADPGAVAVPVDNGFWHLQDLGSDPPSTRVVYCVFTDPGGLLPPWIVYRANAEAVPRLFEAVRSEAASARYAGAPRASVAQSPAVATARASCAPNS